MAIWELRPEGIRRADPTTFREAGIRERDDLQRLLRDHIDVIAPDTLVLAEEYGEWDDSRRRIDLLGLSRTTGNLVVIELKRTDDGGHMDLQAVRYAAMVSTMTFRRAVEAHQRCLAKLGIEEDAETRILEFMEWTEPDADAFGQDVSIVLAAAEFSKEITSSVIWLVEHGIDIRCVRVKPYRLDERILLDVQQILPLPEATDYQIHAREKSAERVQTRTTNRDYTLFDLRIGDRELKHLPKRHLIYHIVRAAADAGTPIDEITDLLPSKGSRFVSVDGEVSEGEFPTRVKRQLAAEGRAFAAKRYFLQAEHLIHQGGRTYAFSNQWGRGTIEAAMNIAERYPELKIQLRESSDDG